MQERNSGRWRRLRYPIDFDRKQARSLLRVSPHYYNTVGDLDTLEAALRELVA